jgi:hypothetical protein
MRNQVLAIALVQNASVDWAEFGGCFHSGNTVVRELSDAVSGHTNALEAFNSMFPDKKKIIEILPSNIIELARAIDPS